MAAHATAAGPAVAARQLLARLGFYLFVVLTGGFFALPMAWLILAPFERTPTLAARLSHPTLANLREVLGDPGVLTSLRNSVLLALYTMVVVVAAATLAAYALSRVRLPGRDLLLYVLLLFSSVVTGTAAMVPLFLLMFDLHLIDTYLGVTLALTGGLLPAAIFILKDFMDATPRSYEESARVFGATPLQILKDVVAPVVRPGMAVIAVWTIVNVWGNFLIPFILLRDPDLAPASVVIFTFYTEGGQANLRLISSFSLLYSIPVVAMYLFVNRRYGFRFYGGVKG
jgi:multiple sugar transport system permease protein